MQNIDFKKPTNIITITLVACQSVFFFLLAGKVFTYILVNEVFENFGEFYWMFMLYILPMVTMLLLTLMLFDLKGDKLKKILWLLGLIVIQATALFVISEARFYYLVEAMIIELLLVGALAAVMYLNKILGRLLVIFPFALLVLYFTFIAINMYEGFSSEYMLLIIIYVLPVSSTIGVMAVTSVLLGMPFVIMFLKAENNVKIEDRNQADIQEAL